MKLEIWEMGHQFKKRCRRGKSRDRQVCNLDVRYRVCLCDVLLIGCNYLVKSFCSVFLKMTILYSHQVRIAVPRMLYGALPRPYSSA